MANLDQFSRSFMGSGSALGRSVRLSMSWPVVTTGTLEMSRSTVGVPSWTILKGGGLADCWVASEVLKEDEI